EQDLVAVDLDDRAGDDVTVVEVLDRRVDSGEEVLLGADVVDRDLRGVRESGSARHLVNGSSRMDGDRAARQESFSPGTGHIDLGRMERHRTGRSGSGERVSARSETQADSWRILKAIGSRGTGSKRGGRALVRAGTGPVDRGPA